MSEDAAGAARSDPYLLPEHSRDPSGLYDDVPEAKAVPEPELEPEAEAVPASGPATEPEPTPPAALSLKFGPAAAALAFLAEEQRRMTEVISRENEHWEKQDERFSALVERMQAGQRTSEELCQHLVKAARSLNVFAEAVLAVPQFGTRDSGTLREAAQAQEVLKNSFYDHHKEMRDRVLADSIRQAGHLAANMEVRTLSLQSVGLETGTHIRERRQSMMAAWNQYEIAVQERHRAVQAGRPVEKDPFVSCRQYDREMAQMRDVEQQYVREMNRVFLETKVDDGRRIDASKSILLDFLLAQKALLEHAVRFSESAIQSVKAIDREADVANFIARADLSESVFEGPPPSRDSVQGLYRREVVREGALKRQGRWVKSNWKDIYVAVSRSGFLHSFDDVASSDPALTVSLRGASVRMAPEVGESVFVVVEDTTGRSKGWWGGGGSSQQQHFFQAPDQETMVDWILAVGEVVEEVVAAVAAIEEGGGDKAEVN